MDATGDFVVTWQSYDKVFLGIYAQRYDSTGVPQGAELTVNTYQYAFEAVAGIDASDDVAIAWASNGPDGDGLGIFARRYSVSLRGDFNRSGQTTAADLSSMLQALCDLNNYKAQYGLSDADLLTIGDFNGDGKVTNADIQGLLVLLANSGVGSSSAAATAAASVSESPVNSHEIGSQLIAVPSSFIATDRRLTR